MNRREFLGAIGVGALTVAGKFPPSKPHFILEINFGPNGPEIWLDGKSPEKGWTWDNCGGSDATITTKNLKFGSTKVESIRISYAEGIGEVDSPAKMVTDKYTLNGKVAQRATVRWDVVGDAEPIKVTLVNGKEISVDKDHLYLKIQF